MVSENNKKEIRKQFSYSSRHPPTSTRLFYFFFSYCRFHLKTLNPSSHPSFRSLLEFLSILQFQSHALPSFYTPVLFQLIATSFSEIILSLDLQQVKKGLYGSSTP